MCLRWKNRIVRCKVRLYGFFKMYSYSSSFVVDNVTVTVMVVVVVGENLFDYLSYLTLSTSSNLGPFLPIEAKCSPYR